MSILQDISKRLIDVASLPPEQRNDALMQVLIYIEEVQYDMVLEQKNLIMSVIEDLIAENDAEQIAKSKLVFTQDVEEQIAPTKNKRANKVVMPVVEDLPDFIDSFPTFKDLPEPIKKLAILRRKELGINEVIDMSKKLASAFDWTRTPEGDNFWMLINEGNLTEFKKKYGNKGEKVDAIINPQLTSGDLPDFIDIFSFVKDLPEPVRKLMSLRRKQDNDTSDVDLDTTLSDNLNWKNTLEGVDFWAKINNEGDLREFKKLYGNKGEGVDVVILTSGDLPDFIDIYPKTKDLPEPVKKLVLFRQKVAGNVPKEKIDLNSTKSKGGFDWDKTPEGQEFWNIIHNEGNLTEFKKKYGNKGEKVDAIINPQLTSGDLPDTIDKFTLIKDLPEPVRKLALLRQKEAGNIKNENIFINVKLAFNWSITPENFDFWSKISDGNLTEFKRIYGNKGENVDNIVNGLVGFNELLEMANKQNAQLINDAFKQAQAVKTRKPRTPKVATKVAEQKLRYLRLNFLPPSGGVIDFEVYSPTELLTLVTSILSKLNVEELIFNFVAVSDLENNKTKVSLKIYDSGVVMVAKLEDKFDTFVQPPLIWIDFKDRGYDKDRLVLNEEILLDAFKQTPKPVLVEKPKPVKVTKPKPVPVAKPKPVKVTKPKAEDDLSFLDDLENIF